MAETFGFELVSPEKLLLSIEAEMVTVPGEEGDMGILPGHSPVISSLRLGVIDVTKAGGGEERIFVAGGFAEMSNNKLTVLAEEAVPVAELKRDKIEAKLKDAREDLADAKEDHARNRAQAEIDKLSAMLEAAA
ncbi:F0F1 ATP synthase subunit epsilon [Ferrovibrio sp. MS7]|jgi:F-type H+-transporting ATPase subunit epsilon|uniref:F0F1 ATP synthase subunit epsilon n=1 Tax=Ferrovibrio plantarum TaxID=3119164 RepID=UPI003135DBF8